MLFYQKTYGGCEAKPPVCVPHRTYGDRRWKRSHQRLQGATQNDPHVPWIFFLDSLGTWGFPGLPASLDASELGWFGSSLPGPPQAQDELARLPDPCQRPLEWMGGPSRSDLCVPYDQDLPSSAFGQP